jgi:hypothetical protein
VQINRPLTQQLLRGRLVIVSRGHCRDAPLQRELLSTAGKAVSLALGAHLIWSERNGLDRPGPAGIHRGHLLLRITAVAVRLPAHDLRAVSAEDPSFVSGTGQFPDRDGKAGSRVTGAAVLLIAARYSADRLYVGTGENYTTTVFLISTSADDTRQFTTNANIEAIGSAPKGPCGISGQALACAGRGTVPSRD